MAKTAAQKAARRRRRQSNVAVHVTSFPSARKSNKGKKRVATVQVAEAINVKTTRGRNGRSRNRRAKRKGGRNSAYTRARYGAGMHSVTDGVNNMKTIHNGSVIEDTFAVRREKVSNIIGFTNTSLQLVQSYGSSLFLNPGNSVLFPIFSQIAATYEQFRVNELIFSYETEAYTASGTNVSAGKVILATNYDPADANFSTDGQMENYFNSDRGAPFGEIVHDVLQGDHALKDQPLKNYYVNSSANLIAPNNDSTQNKFYDVGNFQLGCQGNASSSAEIGELYVTYSFTMIRPKQQTPNGQNFLSSHFVGLTQTTANAFVGSVARAGSNINMTVASNVITFNTLGRYSVIYLSAATTTTFVSATGSGATALSVLDNNGSTGSTPGSGTGAFALIQIWDVTVVGATITYSNTVAAGVAWDLIVSQIPSGLSITPTLSTMNNEVDVLRQDVEDMKRMIYSLQKSFVSEPSTPHTYTESKEEDLGSSVHIPRSAVMALFGSSSSPSFRKF